MKKFEDVAVGDDVLIMTLNRKTKERSYEEGKVTLAPTPLYTRYFTVNGRAAFSVEDGRFWNPCASSDIQLWCIRPEERQ